MEKKKFENSIIFSVPVSMYAFKCNKYYLVSKQNILSIAQVNV